MFQTKCIEEIKIYILHTLSFFSENREVYETMWKNMAVPDRPQMTIQYGECSFHAG